MFPNFEQGVDFMHELAMKKAAPVSVRLVDNLQFQFSQVRSARVIVGCEIGGLIG